MLSYVGSLEVLEYTFDVNALAHTTSNIKLVDVNGDAVKPPKGFTVVEFVADIPVGTTNTSIDIGILTADEDKFVDGANNAAAAVKTRGEAGGLFYRFEGTETVVVKNAGSAAMPSSEKLVKLYFIGQRRYD